MKAWPANALGVLWQFYPLGLALQYRPFRKPEMAIDGSTFMTDVEARCFVRKGNTLVPSDFVADETLSEIPEGAHVLVTIRRARSPQNHRHFFAVLHRALEHMPEEYRMFDASALLDAIKLAVGHVRRIKKLDGTIVEIPDSIDWNAMDESKFQRFKQRALYVLGRVIGCDPCELEPEEKQRRAA